MIKQNKKLAMCPYHVNRIIADKLHDLGLNEENYEEITTFSRAYKNPYGSGYDYCVPLDVAARYLREVHHFHIHVTEECTRRATVYRWYYNRYDIVFNNFIKAEHCHNSYDSYEQALEAAIEDICDEIA